MSATPAPTLRVRTERRQRPFRIGVGLGVFGLLAIIAGGAAMWVNQAIQVASPVARVALPSSTTFEAQQRGYVIVLDRVSSAARLGVTKADPATEVRCEIVRSDGSTATIDGARTFARIETELGTSVGRFDATAGTTTVDCDWKRLASDDYRFVIAPERKGVVVAGLVGVVGGIVLLLVASVFVWVGVRGRAVVEREASAAAEI